MHKFILFFKRIFVSVSSDYKENFEREISFESLNRLIITGIALIILESFVTFHSFFLGLNQNILLTQQFIILANLLFLPFSFYFRKKMSLDNKFKITGYIEFYFFITIIWSCIISIFGYLHDFENFKLHKSVSHTSQQIPAYMITVFGAAILVSIKPFYSFLIYFFVFFIYNFSISYIISGNIFLIKTHTWNSFILNIFAFIASRLVYKSKLKNYISNYKNELLLKNILPTKVITELQETGKTIPEKIENVSILFSDLIDFSKKSKLISPIELISELNEIFTEFDNILEKNSSERIKTIGDAYLGISGTSNDPKVNSKNLILSAIQMIEYLKKRNSSNKIKWEIRIGIHTGEIIGGVVGIKKYIYDIFGDTVNFASRLESHSSAMKINISEEVYNDVKFEFIFKKRSIAFVKGFGRKQMYYVETK